MKSSDLTDGFRRAMHREPALRLPDAGLKTPKSGQPCSPAPRQHASTPVSDGGQPNGQPAPRIHDDQTHPHLPHPEPQCDQAPALGRPDEGEAPGFQRTRVRFIGYRVRPLDPDNFAGSVKDCLDGLRHCALIEGDEPWRIILETEQVKVRSFKEERTVIEIYQP